MSSRQLKKLRRQQELIDLRDEPAHDAESEEEDVQPKQPRANPFAGFAAIAEGNDDEEGEIAEADEAQQITSENRDAETHLPAKPSKKSKKKKKKKTTKRPDPSKEDGLVRRDAGAIDEIDRAIKDLQLVQPSQAKAMETSDAHGDFSSRIAELLRINFQHLKAGYEMRRLFGKEVVQSAGLVGNEDDVPGQNRRRRPATQAVNLEEFLRGHPGKSMPETLLRRNPFVEGKKTWPAGSARGLTMICCAEYERGFAEFAFAHDKVYQMLEATFYHLVQMYDPMKLVHFCHENPYHVSTLIQVSKIAKQDQNAALASDLCERALYTFGRVSLSSFRQKLEQGRARISFSRPENRQFFLATYNYIKNLIQKGTYRTALEWAKLILSLDPSDPYDIINWVHVLAIRAYEAPWFLDLCNSEMLNVSNPGGPMIKAACYIRQTAILAQLQVKDAAGAKTSLLQGMELLPWLYCALYGAVNLDVPTYIWGVRPRNPEEELYTKLYIHMTKDLWDNAQAISLLKEAAEDCPHSNRVVSPAAPPVSLGTARFIYLDNTPALMSAVPHGMLHASPNFDFDPLPPPKAENTFSNDVQTLPWDLSQTHGPADMMRFGLGPDDFNLMEALRDPEADGGQSEDDGDSDGSQETRPDRGTMDSVLRRFIALVGGRVTAQPSNNPTDNRARQDTGVEEIDDATDPPIPGAWVDGLDDWLEQHQDEPFFVDGGEEEHEDVDEMPDLIPMGETSARRREQAGDDTENHSTNDAENTGGE